ncbi:MAG: DUF3870 domain-containing protein [Dehalococcoidia bacterium]
MGQRMSSTIIYVGLARLPQPLATAASAVAVELEVDAATRLIAGVHCSLQFPALERLLQDLVIGKPLEGVAGQAVLELDVRYASPFTTAVRTALLAALRRASEAAAPAAPAATRNGNGTKEAAAPAGSRESGLLLGSR